MEPTKTEIGTESTNRTASELAGNAPIVSLTVFGAEHCQAQFVPLPDDMPIAARINHATSEAYSHAKISALAIIYAGNLLYHQKEIVDRDDPGNWIAWLGNNCPNLSRTRSWTYIKAYLYALKVGEMELEGKSANELYSAAGILKSKDDVHRVPAGHVEDPFYAPLANARDAWRKLYTDAFLAALKPVAVPKILGYVDSAIQELSLLKGKLEARANRDAIKV